LLNFSIFHKHVAEQQRPFIQMNVLTGQHRRRRRPTTNPGHSGSSSSSSSISDRPDVVVVTSTAQSNSSSKTPVRLAQLPPGGKEYVPELYKSMGSKRVRLEQPETEEERLMLKSLPCDTEAALIHLRSLYSKVLFGARLPPIALYSQLTSIISNQFLIDTQLSKLAKANKIITFSTFTSSNYLIVFLDDFLSIRREGIFDRFVKEVLVSPDDDEETSSDKDVLLNKAVVLKRSVENSRYFTKESLRKRWKFEEDEIRQLVNAGYLGIQDGGVYCLSLAGAGEFTKAYEKGNKAVINAIKRSKFGEVLQRVSVREFNENLLLLLLLPKRS
jgi:hypothetical protein